MKSERGVNNERGMKMPTTMWVVIEKHTNEKHYFNDENAMEYWFKEAFSGNKEDYLIQEMPMNEFLKI